MLCFDVPIYNWQHVFCSAMLGLVTSHARRVNLYPLSSAAHAGECKFCGFCSFDGIQVFRLVVHLLVIGSLGHLLIVGNGQARVSCIVPFVGH